MQIFNFCLGLMLQVFTLEHNKDCCFHASMVGNRFFAGNTLSIHSYGLVNPFYIFGGIFIVSQEITFKIDVVKSILYIFITSE